MEAASAMMRSAWSRSRRQSLPTDLKLRAFPELISSSDALQELGRNRMTVSESFTLPYHPSSVWKHENLRDFFLLQQLHRRVLHTMFLIMENLSSLWEEINFEYDFHFVPSQLYKDVLLNYVRTKPSIAIFGPTNSGKTTLLNVLLGKWWLPEQETPNTEVAWRISNGDTPQRSRIEVDSDKVLKNVVWNTDEWLSRVKDEEKDLRRQEGGGEIYFHLKLPNDLLECGVDLWDTPSLTYDKWKMFERLILNKINVIPIFLVDAQECLSEDRDVSFIKTMRRRFPDLPIMLVLGRVDVSVMQLRMDNNFDVSTIESDSDEVAAEVSKNEQMRINMQIPTAKYHHLISSSEDLCAISADKVWEELSNKKPECLRYTNHFNNFIEHLLKVHGNRIERPFYRVYSHLVQAIICARSCLKFYQDKNLSKEDFLKELGHKNENIRRLLRLWTISYAKAKNSYKQTLQSFLERKVDDIYNKVRNTKEENRKEERIENYIVNVVLVNAIDEANKEIQEELKKCVDEIAMALLNEFNGCESWINGVICRDFLVLKNDFFWDRSIIHPARLRRYLNQLTSHFRKSNEQQKVYNVIGNIDFNRIISIVFYSVDILDSDLKNLSKVHEIHLQNIMTTQKSSQTRVMKSSCFPLLEPRTKLLELLSSTLDDVHRNGITRVKHDEKVGVGPLQIEGRSDQIAYTVELQQKAEHIKTSLRFVIGNFNIDKSVFLRPKGFSFDFRKRFIIIYPNVGISLYQRIQEQSLRSWSLEHAVSMLCNLKDAMDHFMKQQPKIAPDLNPRQILLESKTDKEWYPRIVLLGEVDQNAVGANEDNSIHLPDNMSSRKVQDIVAYQLTFAFWIMILKSVKKPETTNNRFESLRIIMKACAVDKTFITDNICNFFSLVFDEKKTATKFDALVAGLADEVMSHRRTDPKISEDSDNDSSSHFSDAVENLDSKKNIVIFPDEY